jgi:hypothetical protein
MITHFISAEIDLEGNTAELQKSVVAELNKYGKPLRWAITSVDYEREKLFVEAVVTKDES